jgi:hypothetical protein
MTTKVVRSSTPVSTREPVAVPQAHAAKVWTGLQAAVAGTRSNSYAVGGFFSPLRNLSTALPAEAFPGVLYVRDRLAQMYERSAYELQPYPGPWLIGSALTKAWSLVAPGVPTPSVVPSEEGNVSLVWHKNGWDVEVEFGEFGTDVWAVNRASQETWHGSLEDTEAELSELLRSINEVAP